MTMQSAGVVIRPSVKRIFFMVAVPFAVMYVLFFLLVVTVSLVVLEIRFLLAGGLFLLVSALAMPGPLALVSIIFRSICSFEITPDGLRNYASTPYATRKWDSIEWFGPIGWPMPLRAFARPQENLIDWWRWPIPAPSILDDSTIREMHEALIDFAPAGHPVIVSFESSAAVRRALGLDGEP